MPERKVLNLVLVAGIALTLSKALAYTGEIRLGLFLENPDGGELAALNHSLEFLRTEWNPLRGVNISLVSTTVHQKNQTLAVTEVCEILKTGVSGLLTLSSCDSLKLLRSQQEVFHMPHLAVYTGHCSSKRNNNFTLSLRESGVHIVSIIDSLVTDLAWDVVAVFYDHAFESSQIKSLLFNLSSHFVHTSFVSLHGPREQRKFFLSDKLKTLVNRKYLPVTYFILLLNENNTVKLLHTAKVMGLLGYQYFWIIVNKDMLKFPTQSFATEDANIAMVTKKWPNSECVTSLSTYISDRLSDIKPKDAYLIDGLVALASVVYSKLAGTDKGNTSQLLDCSLQPAVPWEYGPYIMEELRQLNSTGLSGALYFDEEGYNGNTEHEIMSLRTDGNSTDFVTVGTWKQYEGLRLSQDVFRYSVNGFNNVTFNIGTKEALPFVRVNRTENGTVFQGFCVDILDELALQLNFRYKLHEPWDGQWGSEENGSFNGIIGMVNRKELDFGIGPFSINAERERGVDFTTPYMEDGIGIVLRRPAGESNKLFRMFQPFSGLVWLAIGCSVSAIGVGLYLMTRCSQIRTETTADGQRPDGGQVSLKESLWLIFASLMEQGGENHPVTVSSRVILGFWWVFTILVVSSYTANLAAFLTVTVLDKPIDTLEDLAYNEDITPLVKTGTNIYSLFRKGTKDVYKEIWRKIEAGPKLTDNDEAYNYVRTGKYAFMVDKTQLEYLVKSDCETFMLADESFNNAGVGFVFQENSPMVSDFSFQIIRMQEAGLIERWRQKWWSSADSCSSSGPASQAKRLGMDSTGGPFIIFAIAAGAACLCLVVEMLFSCRQRSIRLNNFNPKTLSVQARK